MLHTAASRVAALDLGFVPGEGGRDMAGILDGAARARSTSSICSAPTNSIPGKLGNAFVVYQGTHGDAGAHRADVILPGAAYTEKDGLYVNFEGRVQRAERATFPPGEAKEDWAILRALSDVLGQRLPYDDLDALRRAIVRRCAAFCDTKTVLPHIGGRRSRDLERHRRGRAIDAGAPLPRPIADFYLTNPIARASETMAECSQVFVTGAMQMAAE